MIKDNKDLYIQDNRDIFVAKEEINKVEGNSKFTLLIYSFTFTFINLYLDISLWKKVRKTIIAFKYIPTNQRDYKRQVIALDITHKRFPQLS